MSGLSRLRGAADDGHGSAPQCAPAVEKIAVNRLLRGVNRDITDELSGLEVHTSMRCIDPSHKKIGLHAKNKKSLFSTSPSISGLPTGYSFSQVGCRYVMFGKMADLGLHRHAEHRA